MEENSENEPIHQLTPQFNYIIAESKRCIDNSFSGGQSAPHYSNQSNTR